MSADSYLEISRSIIWFPPSVFCLPFAIRVGGTSPVFVSDVIMGIMYFSGVAIDGAIQVEMKTQSAESALGTGVRTPMGIRQVVPPTSSIARNRIADNEALRPHHPPHLSSNEHRATSLSSIAPRAHCFFQCPFRSLCCVLCYNCAFFRFASLHRPRFWHETTGLLSQFFRPPFRGPLHIEVTQNKQATSHRSPARRTILKTT